jgi:hypothetical protein
MFLQVLHAGYVFKLGLNSAHLQSKQPFYVNAQIEPDGYPSVKFVAEKEAPIRISSVLTPDISSQAHIFL